MVHVVLFHSVLGLRPSVGSFANQLREAGHIVTTPDLYGGETFDNYETASKKWKAIGIPGILQKAQKIATEIEGDVVFAGFSNGAAVAEFLAATQPNAKGALLFHGALPLKSLELTAWPKHVSAQLHYNDKDPFRDSENDAAFEKDVKASGASFEEFLYEGNSHLFADPDLPDYDEVSATLMMKRTLEFLNTIS